MKVGVIGICGFGRHHARAFREIGWDVAAGVDRSEQLAEAVSEFGARGYRDFREMLAAEQLDALSVSLPPRYHPEIIEAACELNLPVLCEKPVAPSAREAEELLNRVGEEARVAVGFSFRYNAAYLRLRELIRSGELGRVRSILARKCWGTRTSWRLEEGGGVVFVKDIHYYDLIPWLLDESPERVCAIGGSFYHQAPVEDSYQALLGFPSGAAFHLESAWWTLPSSVNQFELVGTRARVTVEGDRLSIDGEVERVEEPPGEPMLVSEVRAFTDWLAGTAPRPPGLAEALEANRLAQRVLDDLRS